MIGSFERHLRAENRAENTVISYLVGVRQFESFLAAHGQNLLDACAGRDFVSRRDTAIIMLLLDTGARRTELLSLRLGDVSFDYEDRSAEASATRDRSAGRVRQADATLDHLQSQS